MYVYLWRDAVVLHLSNQSILLFKCSLCPSGNCLYLFVSLSGSDSTTCKWATASIFVLLLEWSYHLMYQREKKTKKKPVTNIQYGTCDIFNETIDSYCASIVEELFVFASHSHLSSSVWFHLKKHIDNMSCNYIQPRRIRSTQHKSGHWARAWPSILLARVCGRQQCASWNYAANLECVDKLRDQREMNWRQQYAPKLCVNMGRNAAEWGKACKSNATVITNT